MNNSNKNIKLIVVLIILLTLLSGISVVTKFSLPKRKENVIDDSKDEPINNNEPVKEESPYKQYIDLWKTNHEINSDYIGELYFESGIIHESVVQANDVYDDDGNFYNIYDVDGNKIKESQKDDGCSGYACNGNDVYLWTYWKTGEYDKYEHGGSVFVDYRNTLYDENIIVYGHHFSVEFDKERTRSFTPLENFVNKDYYEDNKYVDFVLEDEIRRYEVAVVFRFSLNNSEDTEYYRTEYNRDLYGDEDPGYKERYFKAIQEVAYYDTGVELTSEDKTLTLQTCFSGEPDYREVLVLKQIEVIDIDDLGLTD